MIADQLVQLQFKWSTIILLEQHWGDDWFERYCVAVERQKLQDLAEITAFGSGGQLLPQDVIDASPYINPLCQEVSKAISLASWGPKGPPQAQDPNPQMPPEATPKSTWGGRLRSLFGLGTNSP